MSIHVALRHRTSYRYARAVNLGPQTVRLRPAPHCRTRILAYSLKATPTEHFLNWQQDPQANYLARLVFPKPTSELTIEVELVAEMAAMNPFDFFLEPSVERWPFAYEAELLDELEPYRKTLPSTPRFEALVASVTSSHEASGPVPTNDFLVGLNQRLCGDLEYRVRMEPGLQTPEETLTLRSGSCRDSGWLLVQLLRRLGFAARFVSGYLVQLVADTKPLEGPSGPTSDFVDLHAWCEVYLPGAGWIGLDPTSGLLAGEGHIPLACTADPSLAAPVSGLVDRVETTFEHAMTVERIFEVPRVTKPYTEAQWARLVDLGDAVDARLDADDVRLTMGGEPTFLSATDLDAEEWNTAALGPTKRAMATDLFQRLRAHYAPAGLVHFGQGKWYPGEPLPRWSLNLFWRRDGQPIWNDGSLLADEGRPTGATPDDARRLLEAVAGKVGIATGNVFPAFEDVYYYLWRERRLPINVDPLEGGRLDDRLERERLVRLFATGLDRPAGHVLPIAHGEGKGFRSTGWHFRGGHCWLVPGDSPLGMRLPLDAQPWVAPGDRPPSEVRDPAEARGPLPARVALGVIAPAAPVEDRVPSAGESASWVVRTAICAEPRQGVLYVFMPPLDRVEDYLALVTAVEAAARETALRVVLEGYPPPRDPRLVLLSVTPDPGVIEVNVQPAATWREIVDNTTRLYALAREARLVAEKFELDGRHAGTGGGNHVVLGGATPADSPFLRRPDLLRSLIGYVHQHPSLSFLFSGLFIGPTSQAPRVDEARNDALFEMEIAFQEVARRTAAGDPAPPWLVDRIFRDLLTDVTGNTHRSEICVDKLFSPDGAAGRLGLVELRALEMPPHARMSLAQQLLLRALVAWFWRIPFAPERLARWGTELHDRFMLPFFVREDLEAVLGDLRGAGFAFETSFFAPHFEFRFPKVGDFAAEGVLVTLRTALEPWNVMGEDATPGGTARYVDSSLERLEVHADGLATTDRFALAVNGIELPLHATGRHGEGVAGVRFRAWQPPRCLHPHIPVHAPLVFDLVDRWNDRSLGGATYHVVHPGGRAHDTRPVNALEAEGRRRARFERTGHSQGKLELRRIAESTDFPLTLDLRRS